MVTIATFTSYTEALLARTYLQGSGIESMIPNENAMRIRTSGLNPGLGMLQDGVSLQVAEDDAERAKELLEHAAEGAI